MTKTHGKYSMYASGCRCDICREYKKSANSVYYQTRMKKTSGQVSAARQKVLLDNEKPHGTAYKYYAGCRCGLCSQARREYTWLRKYNLSPQQYYDLLLSQGGTCAICPRTPDDNKSFFSIDHNHTCCPAGGSCGKCIRGLLCLQCNRGIGFLQDSVILIESALKYLKSDYSPLTGK